MANSIEGKTVIGAPMSQARLENANTICFSCMLWARTLFTTPTLKAGMYRLGQCYVCEGKTEIKTTETK